VLSPTWYCSLVAWATNLIGSRVDFGFLFISIIKDDQKLIAKYSKYLSYYKDNSTL
tara:strand:- start:231 stop:398 length:168 start_codon:yes stop_codon:yes gene_type:complete